MVVGAALATLLTLIGGAPTAEPITIATGDGLRLAGTLTRPAEPGPHPTALILGGLGPRGRDGDGQYAHLAAALARRGVATVRYDKRGTGDSPGHALSWLDADRLTADAAAALRATAAHSGLPVGRIALVGHSQGGTLALRLAAAVPVAAVVTLAAPGRPLGRFPRAAGPLPDILTRMVGATATRATLHRDPTRDARRVAAPVLLIHGVNDPVVPRTSLDRLHRARRDAARPTATRGLRGLGHTFRTPSGRPHPAPPRLAAAFITRHAPAVGTPSGAAP